MNAFVHKILDLCSGSIAGGLSRLPTENAGGCKADEVCKAAAAKSVMILRGAVAVGKFYCLH